MPSRARPCNPSARSGVRCRCNQTKSRSLFNLASSCRASALSTRLRRTAVARGSDTYFGAPKTDGTSMVIAKILPLRSKIAPRPPSTVSIFWYGRPANWATSSARMPCNWKRRPKATRKPRPSRLPAATVRQRLASSSIMADAGPPSLGMRRPDYASGRLVPRWRRNALHQHDLIVPGLRHAEPRHRHPFDLIRRGQPGELQLQHFLLLLRLLLPCLELLNRVPGPVDIHFLPHGAKSESQQHRSCHEFHAAASRAASTRSLALRARGFSTHSWADGVIGRLVRTVKPAAGPCASARNVRFTMRSSSEWKARTTSRPPGRNSAAICRSAGSRLSSSWFTAIRSA